MSERRFNAFITKYALTRGIFQVSVSECGPPEGMVTDFGSHRSFYHKPDWHVDEASARAQAEKMRGAKVTSLEKQLAKLRALQFSTESM